MKKDNIKLFNFDGFGKKNKLTKSEKFAFFTDICAFCQVYSNEFGNQPIGGIHPDVCKFTLSQKYIYKNRSLQNSDLIVATQDNNHRKVLGWLFANKSKCKKKSSKFIVLDMVCVNTSVKNNKSFRYMMGLFLLNVKLNHPNYDAILEVANINYNRGAPYGSGSISSEKYGFIERNAARCEDKRLFKGGATMSMSEMEKLFEQSGIEDKIIAESRLRRKADLKRLQGSYPTCPLPRNDNLFLKGAQTAERLVCNYGRWGFELQSKYAQNLQCFDTNFPYDIMIHPISQYEIQDLLEGVLLLIQHKIKRLDEKGDKIMVREKRCLNPKYGIIY